MVDVNAEARRKIIRRATWYTIAFGAAGVAVALGGAALIALMMSSFGELPFLPTWLALSGIAIGAGIILVWWQRRREGKR